MSSKNVTIVRGEVVQFSWYRYGVDTIWSIVNGVGYFFSSMFGGADAVRPRQEGTLSRDYRGRQSGMGNVKSASQFKAQMPPSS